MKYYIGIDLGGTFVKAGVVDENCNIVAKASVDSADVAGDAEKVADRMAECARQALANANLTMDDVESIGIGTPGSVDPNTGMIIYANNLNFLNTPMRQYLEARTGKKIYLENDANVAAYGEVLAGAAKGYNDAIVITLGTGVGGGIIIDGKIYSGFNHFGGELGHAVIVKGGRQCTCGRKGCLEAYSSATALIKMTQEAMEANKDSKLWEVAKTLEEVNGKTAFDAMRLGDPVGAEVVNQYIQYLGCGLANFVNIFQPEILLIGGGISKEGETLLAPLREILKEETYGISGVKSTTLKTCALGNDAGTIGAAFLWKIYA
ncbi:MAG TPA: ROK family protein [Candidatus Merdivicinus excrementipullorum]|uniref:ROK family protein n=1 Tax=Candidatus Merdivicinus excrementipullorum TaxID=2840867 RepID=A0A9D1FPA8_9FIRM|nr:ROK family protein [Candidatus Merdivicinus excrementipullorum]